MGNRANIELKYQSGESVFFYSHWDGSNVDEIVRKALARKQRWNDEAYLARIIFSQMIKDTLMEETGYGISPWECEAGSPKCIVYLAANMVNTSHGISYTFADFIK